MTQSLKAHIPTIVTIVTVCATVLLVAGGIRQTVADHERRVTSLEGALPQLGERTARIEGKIDILLIREGKTPANFSIPATAKTP